MSLATPSVRLEVFEGPLDLLLHLIKRSEVEITDIPIALITDQYVEALEHLPSLNLDGAGEYLVMAATLMLIKSRMLLPPDPNDEAEDEGDPRAELVQQLLEYQRYREAAAHLGDRLVLERDVFRGAGEAAPTTVADDELPVREASLADLLGALRSVLDRAREPTPHEILRPGVSVGDCAHHILARFTLERSVEFTSVFDDDVSRTEVIVTFLALLELMRVGVVQASQDRHYDTITLTLVVESIEVAAEMARHVGTTEPWKGDIVGDGDERTD